MNGAVDTSAGGRTEGQGWIDGWIDVSTEGRTEGGSDKGGTDGPINYKKRWG